MKRTILAVILIISVFGAVSGQTSSPIDLILLLDTSAAMSSSYENVNNYLTGQFLSDFMRVGDTFHLIAFSGTPRLDVSRRISGVGDVETVVARMLLQYPVERGSNLGSALSFTEQYITTLPSRNKKIVIVSLADSDASNLVSSARQRLGSNTTVDFIPVTSGQPLTNIPSSGRTVVTGVTTVPPAVTTPVIVTPPVVITPPIIENQDPIIIIEVDPPIDRNNEFVSTPSTDNNVDVVINGSTNITTDNNIIADNNITNNNLTPVQLTPERTGSSFSSSLLFTILGIILALLLLGLIIYFASRKLSSSSNAVAARAAPSRAAPPPRVPSRVVPETVSREKPIDHSKDLAKYASSQTKRTTPYDDRPASIDKNKPVVINPTGPLLLNLFVEDQNTSIGKRNIHSLKSGYRLTVGGGKSDDFLIFLVPMPANIGEIRRNGSQLTFIPRKPKYFPETGSSEIRDCINKTIRIVSDRNYEMRFRFEMYEDPLAVLNRMLMCVNVPG